jgi:hypothetical protein
MIMNRFITYDPLVGVYLSPCPPPGAVIGDIDDVLYLVAITGRSCWSCSLAGAREALLDGAYLASVQQGVDDDEWQSAIEQIYSVVTERGE